MAQRRRFQSTLPARRATVSADEIQKAGHFNPRSPHGERLANTANTLSARAFQSTLPRTGSDFRACLRCKRHQFQSTLPARGATAHRRSFGGDEVISIHAPRAGSDLFRGLRLPRFRDFNPRSPHGERPIIIIDISEDAPFQSTLPARGATLVASCAGNPHIDFNPRSPHGERRRCASWRCPCRYFNPRSPHGERPPPASPSTRTASFQSTLPARGATHRYVMVSQWVEFQSTLPARRATPSAYTVGTA